MELTDVTLGNLSEVSISFWHIVECVAYDIMYKSFFFFIQMLNFLYNQEV